MVGILLHVYMYQITTMYTLNTILFVKRKKGFARKEIENLRVTCTFLKKDHSSTISNKAEVVFYLTFTLFRQKKRTLISSGLNFIFFDREVSIFSHFFSVLGFLHLFHSF